MAKVWVLHGPNLNLLSFREPNLYGNCSLATINENLSKQSKDANIELCCHQTNSESELINLIHLAKNELVDYIIINPAAFTHTSVAIRDAFLAVAIPFIEVHISNLFQRESFRQCSYLADIAAGIIMGLGPNGYYYALQAVTDNLIIIA